MSRRVMRVQLHRRMAATENKMLQSAWANKPVGVQEPVTPARRRADSQGLPSSTAEKSEDGGRVFHF